MEALALVAVAAGAHLEVEGAVHAVLLGPEDPRQVLRHGAPSAPNNAFFENFANFWRASSRLYQNEILQENMRFAAFFKIYQII